MGTLGPEGGCMVLSVVDAIQCPNCKDIIFSRAHHDYHSCTCGGISIDGGFEYLKFGWDDKLVNREEIGHFKLELSLSKADLYNDWNRRIDKLGIITDKKLKKGEADYVHKINSRSE